jgi:Ricin-type beta-trefoil lectin domain
MFSILNIQSATKSVTNFTAKSKTLITLSLVAGTVFAFSLAPMSTVFALQNESNQTTQINQIQFEPSVDLQDVKGYLESRQFDNLKYASVTAELETNNHIIPLNIDYDLKDINKTIESYNNQKKAIVDGIRKSKAQPQPTKESIREQNTKIADDILKTAKESEAINKKTKNNGSKNIIPSQVDLDFVKENGYLPAPKVNKAEIEAKVKELGLPQEYVIYATDPQITGRLANARPEDREAVLTPVEKNDRAEKQADQKIQEDVVSQTDEMQLKDIEKTLSKVTSIKVSQLSYFTNLGDNNTEKTAKIAGKANKKQGDKSDTAKVKAKSQIVQSSNQTKKPKLEDNIKQTVTQDITGQFKQSKEEEKKVKDSQEKDKQDYLQRAKIGKQQHNKIEQAMYAQEGIKVDAIEDTVVEPKKVGFVEGLLSLGGLKAEAKGLNNTQYALLLYASQDQNLAITFNSSLSGQPGSISTSNGTYGTQRFCFDNDNNRIQLAYGGDCSQVYNLCLDDRESRYAAGDTVQLYTCNYSYDQKWFFDEEGRIASIANPGVCIDSYGGLANGARLGLWSCHNGSSENWRAGFSNSGVGSPGMTIWAIRSSNNLYGYGNSNLNACQGGACENGFNGPGHAFVEFWNNYNGGFATQNTFSRWDFDDNDCQNINRVNLSNNNICDRDKITVDVEIDLKNNPNKYSGFRRRGVYLNKAYYDYMVFGSGYRSNYRNGVRVDLGGDGTYSSNNVSQSRNTNYRANYGIFSNGNFVNTSYVCSGQSLKLWNSAYGYDNLNTGWYNGNIPSTPDSIYYQL